MDSVSFPFSDSCLPDFILMILLLFALIENVN